MQEELVPGLARVGSLLVAAWLFLCPRTPSTRA